MVAVVGAERAGAVFPSGLGTWAEALLVSDLLVRAGNGTLILGAELTGVDLPSIFRRLDWRSAVIKLGGSCRLCGMIVVYWSGGDLDIGAAARRSSAEPSMARACPSQLASRSLRSLMVPSCSSRRFLVCSRTSNLFSWADTVIVLALSNPSDTARSTSSLSTSPFFFAKHFSHLA